MGVCILGMGDCSDDTSIKNYIRSDVDIKSTVETMIQSGTTTQVDVNQSNNSNPDIYPLSCCVQNGKSFCDINEIRKEKVCNGTFSIIQSNKAQVSVISNLSQTTITDQQNKVTSIIANKLKSELDKYSQQDINIISNILGKQSATDIVNNIQTSVKQDLATKLDVSTVNSIFQSNVQANNSSFIVCGPLTTGACTINQDNLIDLQISNYLNAMANVVQDNQAVTDLKNQIDSVLKKKDVGIIGGIMDGLQNILGEFETSCIFLCVIILLLFVGIIVYKVTKK